MLGSDLEHESWDGIIIKTLQKKRPERLIWDIFRISHHCSYNALSAEKGRKKTEPTKLIKSLFEKGQIGCYLISSSDIIPSEDTDQPPHMQAAAYYSEVAENKKGEFLVTMETPTDKDPKRIVIEIGKCGPTWKKITGITAGIGAVTSKASPRQGCVSGI
jgi:hypothetical protein